MKTSRATFDCSEDEAVLSRDVSDEALEIAAGSGSVKVNFTLGMCTGLSVCDG